VDREIDVIEISVADCLHLPLEDKSVDLTFTSPPYEDARLYGIGFRLKGQDWVDWAVPRFLECLRVTRGLTCWVVQGRTRKFQWSAIPVLFMSTLIREGVNLRRPQIYHRIGIPGSGGPDDWRNDYEYIIRATHGGKLPWSDNTATGHLPKYGCFGGNAPGGHKDGDVNHLPTIKAGGPFSNRDKQGVRTHRVQKQYALANPGDVLKCSAGGGQMGNKLCHENEAPFPEALVEPFVKCFCPPDGTVLDPMCGSGTTLAVAQRLGRNAIGYDIRESQVELSRLRVAVDPQATFSGQ